MYKLSFYVPVADSEKVKSAVFATGAGQIGNYDYCCWETLGYGQFRALIGSNPTIGKQNILEQVAELKVELVCDDHLIRDAVRALKQAHPYEEPAYQVYKLEEL